MDTNLFHPWPLTLTPKVICKNGAKNETYTWRPGKSIKFEFFSHPCLAPMDTNLFDPWTLTLTPKVICKNGAKIETYTWRPGKSIKFEFFLTPAWRPWIPTYLTHDLWPWPQRSYVKTAPKNQKNLKINKVRIFSHPCLAPIDTNLFDPWTLTLTPKVICKKRRQNRNLHLETRKLNKVRIFFSPLPGAHGYQLIWPMTFDLDPKGHM